ncbi:MAG: hypothetical protein IID41_11940 [Planctomycetes bacterium]|nr:hypothetical protein [Planctomycetota bacterium]
MPPAAPRTAPDPWWTLEFQRAANILADPIFHGLKIQITGQGGCGHHPPTADPDELERFAKEVGLDASYAVLTASGRPSWPVALSPPPGSGDNTGPKRRMRVRIAK